MAERCDKVRTYNEQVVKSGQDLGSGVWQVKDGMWFYPAAFCKRDGKNIEAFDQGGRKIELPEGGKIPSGRYPLVASVKRCKTCPFRRYPQDTIEDPSPNKNIRSLSTSIIPGTIPYAPQNR